MSPFSLHSHPHTTGHWGKLLVILRRCRQCGARGRCLRGGGMGGKRQRACVRHWPWAHSRPWGHEAGISGFFTGRTGVEAAPKSTVSGGYCAPLRPSRRSERCVRSTRWKMSMGHECGRFRTAAFMTLSGGNDICFLFLTRNVSLCSPVRAAARTGPRWSNPSSSHFLSHYEKSILAGLSARRRRCFQVFALGAPHNRTRHHRDALLILQIFHIAPTSAPG